MSKWCDTRRHGMSGYLQESNHLNPTIRRVSNHSEGFAYCLTIYSSIYPVKFIIMVYHKELMKLGFIFIFMLCFEFSFAQNSKEYKANLPDYSASKIDPIPMAPPPPPNPIPIDGGVGLLLAAGLGYGVKRMKKK